MTPNKALRRTAKRRSYSPLAFAAGLSRVLAVVQDVHFGHRAGNQNRKKKRAKRFDLSGGRTPPDGSWCPPGLSPGGGAAQVVHPAGSRSHPPCRRRRGGPRGRVVPCLQGGSLRGLRQA